MNGGRRPGAGRPKGSKSGPRASTISKELAREALRALVLKHMGEMIAAQIAAAKGYKYLMYRKKAGGEFKAVTHEMIKGGLLAQDDVIIEVWDKQPSTPAFTDLMNRALDKPAEQKHEIDVNLPGVEAVLAKLLAARKRVADARSGS